MCAPLLYAQLAELGPNKRECLRQSKVIWECVRTDGSSQTLAVHGVLIWRSTQLKNLEGPALAEATAIRILSESIRTGRSHQESHRNLSDSIIVHEHHQNP